MDKKLKITLAVFIIVLIMLVIIITMYAKRGNELNNLKNMYTDIENLEDNISMYYLDNGNLPVKEENVEFKNAINPNDDSLYYKIDLQLLGSINLTYGNEKLGQDDIYIVNNNSHTVYYYKGVVFQGKTYFTKENLKYEYINLENYK